MIIGYARVSTEGQSEAAQVDELRANGAEKIFREKASGAKTDRAQLRRALSLLAPGDVFMVTCLDRLARSTRDLLNIVTTIADRGARFRSIADSWADTTSPQGKLILTVFSGFAEFERNMIRARTAEGRARAKANGVRFGRKPTLTPHQQREAIRRVAEGELHRHVAESYNVSRSTITRVPGLSNTQKKLEEGDLYENVMRDIRFSKLPTGKLPRA